jgi:hypothetical protein
MSRKNRANKSNFTERYTGDLATPICEPMAAVVGGPGESEAEAMRRIAEQLGLKLNKLFDWYAIDPAGPDAGMYLALKLGMAHVPGMQVRHELRRRGRKRTWKDGLGSELVRDVAALQQAKKLNYKQAITELKKNKEKPWWAYSIPNLITRHRQARNDRPRLTEFLPLSKLRELFEMAKTDENSSVQN